MARRLVLETGGSPPALCGAENCGDKSRSADHQCRGDSSAVCAGEKTMEERLPQGESVGVIIENKQVRIRHVDGCCYKLAVKWEKMCVSEFSSVGGGPNAATGTTQHNRHYSEEQEGGFAASGRMVILLRERKRCFDSTNLKISTALIPELPSSTGERQGRYRSTVKVGKESILLMFMWSATHLLLPLKMEKQALHLLFLPAGGRVSDCDELTRCDQQLLDFSEAAVCLPLRI